MADINLIPPEEKESARIELLQKRLQIFSIGFLVMTAGLTILTLSFFAMSASRRTELIALVEDSSSQINKLKAHEELVVVVKDKVSVASQIITSRVELTEVFEKLSQLVPESVHFTDIRVAAGKMVISGRAKTSADVAGLATSLVSAGGSEIVSDVSVDSLSSGEDGTYIFVISAKLVGQAAAQANVSSRPGQSTSGEEISK